MDEITVFSVSDGTTLVEVVLPDDCEGGAYSWRVSVEGVQVATSASAFTMSLDALGDALDWWRSRGQACTPLPSVASAEECQDVECLDE